MTGISMSEFTAIATLIITLLMNAAVVVWGAATIKTKLDQLTNVVSELKETQKGFVSFVQYNESMKRIWNEIDALKQKV